MGNVFGCFDTRGIENVRAASEFTLGVTRFWIGNEFATIYEVECAAQIRVYSLGFGQMMILVAAAAAVIWISVSKDVNEPFN